jgi:hypothetical protein
MLAMLVFLMLCKYLHGMLYTTQHMVFELHVSLLNDAWQVDVVDVVQMHA